MDENVPDPLYAEALAEFVRLFRDDGPVWIAMTKELGLTLD